MLSLACSGLHYLEELHSTAVLFCSLMMEGHFLTAGQTCILVCIATLPPEAVFSSLLLVRGLGLS